ncbi:MAG: cation transporter [Nanoarchaeota archaeon]
MVKISLGIRGMHCESCAKLIENEMENKVKKIKVNFANKKAEIEFDEENIGEAEIKDKITKLGYKVK